MTDDSNVGDRATPRSGNGGSRPVPDPTELTDRAIAKVENSLTQYIDGEIKALTTLVSGNKALTDERFGAAEKLRIEQKQDTKAAVDAALSAAKEAVKEQTTASERSIDKSEKSTGDILKQQADTFAKAVEGLGDKIDDLKQRIIIIEATKVGANENRTGLYAAIGVGATVILLAIAILTFVLSNAPA